jgi:hypothetical protein
MRARIDLYWQNVVRDLGLPRWLQRRKVDETCIILPAEVLSSATVLRPYADCTEVF